ncbi:MAG: serine--tRNA ligase [Candidatus Eisenbacteria bacterium]|nr:serine--tRNA ligase [Candidatus Eisenbacteria bacterium]
MYDLKFVREHEEELRRAIAEKGESADLEGILERDRRRREWLVEVEKLKAERNRVSQEIGRAKASGADVSAPIESMRAVGERIQALDAQVRAIEEEIEGLVAWLPNLPHASVPRGDESANRVVRTWGEPRREEGLRDHLEIGAQLGILDIVSAAELSGTGFAAFLGMGARLERALINFMLDRHAAAGYREMRVPYATRGAALFGCGQLPKLAEDMYALAGEDLYLIPTGEVPLTNYLRGASLREADLPVRFVGYTPCFRKEAGAHGKQTHGLIRLHQFDKVELVKLVHPERSYDELELLTQDAEGVLQALGLPYRVLLLASGDLSFAAAKCYDLELWAPGEGRWLEVSSCSNFEDFQARRIGLRYRDGQGRLRHVHTLNGSGVALPRLTVALLEHYQRADGGVDVPEALREYLQGRATLMPGPGM